MKQFLWAFALLAGTAQAQEMTIETCRGSVATLKEVVDIPSVSPTVDPIGRCTAVDVVLYQDENLKLRADWLYWRLDGTERWINERLPPTRIEMSAEGIRTETKTGDVVLDYLLSVQSKRAGIFADVIVEWHEDESELVLETAYLDFGGLGHVELSGRVAGVNLSNRLTMRASALTAALTSLDLTVETTGLFESYALIPLGTLVLRGEADPARAVAIIKSHRISDIAVLDPDLIDENSKDALIRLAEEMPNPNGELNLSISSVDGISLLLLGSTFLGRNFEGIEDALSIFTSTDLKIDWTALSKP